MARSLQEIRDIIKTKARTFPSMDNLLFSDDVGAIQGSQFISATESVVAGQQLFELTADTVKASLDAAAAAAPSGNAAWIQARILEFQFGDQIEVDDNFNTFYPVPDVSKQIITRTSVFVDPVTSNIQIKVAKESAPPVPLTGVELDALEDYYFGTGDTQGVGFAGVSTTFLSQDPDRIFVEGQIVYLGQFDPAVVKTNVIAAIEAFIASFQDQNFDGTIKMQKLTEAILAVDGVSRFDYAAADPIRVRPFNVVFAGATSIPTDSFYNTVAGYLISEDTAGETLADKLTTLLETN